MGKSMYNCLREFFYSVNEKVGFKASVNVKDDSNDEVYTFREADIELLIAKSAGGIKIKCKNNDDVKYKELGFADCYTERTAKFEITDYRDFQRSVKQLKITPKQLQNKYIFINSNSAK